MIDSNKLGKHFARKLLKFYNYSLQVVGLWLAKQGNSVITMPCIALKMRYSCQAIFANYNLTSKSRFVGDSPPKTSHSKIKFVKHDLMNICFFFDYMLRDYFAIDTHSWYLFISCDMLMGTTRMWMWV